MPDSKIRIATALAFEQFLAPDPLRVVRIHPGEVLESLGAFPFPANTLGSRCSDFVTKKFLSEDSEPVMYNLRRFSSSEVRTSCRSERLMKKPRKYFWRTILDQDRIGSFQFVQNPARCSHWMGLSALWIIFGVWLTPISFGQTSATQATSAPAPDKHFVPAATIEPTFSWASGTQNQTTYGWSALFSSARSESFCDPAMQQFGIAASASDTKTAKSAAPQIIQWR